MFSFATILIEEEDRERKMLVAAAAAIPQTLFQLWKKHRATDSIVKVKRRLIFWDRERAVS
jgi:TPP-dependent trihydroxycyclohexane-1,2-dione (THcHDO) dehydratase